jgi:hypothetical protein
MCAECLRLLTDENRTKHFYPDDPHFAYGVCLVSWKMILPINVGYNAQGKPRRYTPEAQQISFHKSQREASCLFWRRGLWQDCGRLR